MGRLQPGTPVRFIPAGAGNTLAKNQGKEEECGLSPLTRGTHTATRPDPHATRFIPAGAGNTGSSRHRSNTASVYPRWRGEHVPEMKKAGKTLRFIPAGAGNTLSRRAQSDTSPVYPRWRGEHDRFEPAWYSYPGLSPLARGTLMINSNMVKDMRFIPAGAGNTGGRMYDLFKRAVYPRWRGEHAIRSSVASSSGGLSPLARGTHRLTHDHRESARFIPAGAGNTLPCLSRKKT